LYAGVNSGASRFIYGASAYDEPRGLGVRRPSTAQSARAYVYRSSNGTQQITPAKER